RHVRRRNAEFLRLCVGHEADGLPDATRAAARRAARARHDERDQRDSGAGTETRSTGLQESLATSGAVDRRAGEHRNCAGLAGVLWRTSAGDAGAWTENLRAVARAGDGASAGHVEG